MARWLAVILCSLFPLFSVMADSSPLSDEPVEFQMLRSRLVQTTQRYLHFINRMGRGESESAHQESQAVFSEDFRQFFNGSLRAASREHFVNCLLDLYSDIGSWTVTPVEVLFSPSPKTIVLRLLISMQSQGEFTAIAILHCDEDDRICEMNEVFNRLRQTID